MLTRSIGIPSTASMCSRGPATSISTGSHDHLGVAALEVPGQPLQPVRRPVRVRCDGDDAVAVGVDVLGDVRQPADDRHSVQQVTVEHGAVRRAHRVHPPAEMRELAGPGDQIADGGRTPRRRAPVADTGPPCAAGAAGGAAHSARS